MGKMQKLAFGVSIRTQLIVLLFGLSAIAIGVVGFLGIRGLLSSGDKAEQITATATEGRARQLLEQTAIATAAKNSAVFQNVQRRTYDTSEYVKGLFENPGYFPNTHWSYDANMSRLPAGQFSNNDKELGSVFVSTAVPITAAMKSAMELTSYLDYYAPQTLKNEKNAVAIYYINSDGAARYYPNIGLAGVSEPDFQPAAAEFFTVAAPENNPDKAAQWTAVYDDPAGNGLMITASHPVFAICAFVGVVGIDFTLANIAKNIEDYSPIESSYAFLLDKDGRAIALPAQGYRDILGREAKKAEFGADLKKTGGEFGAVLKKMQAKQAGFDIVNPKTANLYVAFAPLEGTNFSLGIVARKDVLLKVVGDLQAQVKKSTNEVLYYQILPISALILVLVWIAGFIYIRLIAGPIVALTEKTNRITRESLSEGIDIKASNNEVRWLAEAFNNMMHELAASYKSLEDKVVEIENAKAKDDAILNSIGDGLIVADSSGAVLLINNIAAELLGIKQQTAVGRVLKSELYDQKGVAIPPKDHPMQVALTTGKKVNRYLLSGRADGTKVAVNVTATPVTEEGRTIGSIQILRDVTKEEEVDRMKTEFISVASHQLRTPLSAIKWFSEMLLNHDAGKLADDQTEFVKNISISTDRMIELVNSLLNISRLESGRIQVEPVPTDIKQLISGLVNDLKGKADERQQKLVVKVDAGLSKINLDPRLISQVYFNLLTNAIKYSPKGATISVTVAPKDGEMVSEVSDSGYGIPKAEQDKVFDKFYRGSNVVTVETDGTGLGMYLVKSIVESSGGKIWFKSEEGKGSTFWFSLPLEGMKAKAGEVTLD